MIMTNRDCAPRQEILLGYDYHNGDTRKYGNSNLFRRLDKDNITSQSTVSIVIGTGNICRDKMVCERLAGNKGILLKHTIPCLKLLNNKSA